MRLFILILLLTANICSSQWIQKIDQQYTTLTFGVDPYASYKEKGPNIIAELTHVSYFGYVKVGVQIFPTLIGGYYDVTGGVGLNQKSAIFGVETRLYQGIRGGHNWRGQTKDFQTYDGPLFGIDLGFDIKLSENTSIGSRVTSDWREDMEFSGADAKWIQSYFITFTTKL